MPPGRLQAAGSVRRGATRTNSKVEYGPNPAAVESDAELAAMSAAEGVEMFAKSVSPTTPPASSAPSRGKLASLYYFADNTDYALIFTGCLFKLAFGATQGFVIVIFGDFFDVSPEKFAEAGVFFLGMMAILGAPWLG